MAIEIIPIHFDVPGHEIPLGTFIQTSKQTEVLVHRLNQELFGGELEFELLVLPPEEGTFLNRLGLFVVCGAAWAFVESDIGKAFIKGLTDHEPAYWSELAGKGVKETIASAERVPTVEKQGSCAAASAHPYATILARATTGFLQKSTPELLQVGITPSNFREAYQARNEFYASCVNTPELKGIGFDERPVFPIRRDDFTRLQTDLPPLAKEPEPPWSVTRMLLKVTSPNWDRGDNARQWKGRDQTGHDRYFRIEDEEFWRRVQTGAVNLNVIDIMDVQLAFQGTNAHPRNCRALRVLEFNGLKLAEPLTNDALLAILGELADTRGTPSRQIDLFDIDEVMFLDKPGFRH